jgi:hypothetical protein
MTLTEKFISDAVRIDFGGEILYGSDEVFDTHPVRFATVEFILKATDVLVEIADRIRFDKGYPPVYPRADGMDYDADGFYNFYIGISKLPGDGQACRADKCISFVVVNSDSSDNEDMYEIELSESDQGIVLDILDKQCRRHLGKSCADLLAEAERGMQDVPPDLFSVPPDIPENHNGGLIT